LFQKSHIQSNWIADLHEPPAGACPTRHGMIGKTRAILEKLEEAPWLTVMHVRTERGAHRNLTEINVFVSRPLSDYGSTAIVETL
jgi:hypothetical protein